MSTVTASMSIGEVLRLDRDTARVFLSFGMHCLGCPHATGESIQQAGAAHGVDVDELVRQLNALLESKA